MAALDLNAAFTATVRAALVDALVAADGLGCARDAAKELVADWADRAGDDATLRDVLHAGDHALRPAGRELDAIKLDGLRARLATGVS
jgi:hypothetical protein